jgi:acetyltransferase
VSTSWKDDLSALFSPGNVAIVGASERSHYCVLCVENLDRLEFPPDRLFLVNPTRSEVFGRKAYPSLAAIQQPVHQAVLLVNRDRTLDAFHECIAKGVKSIVMLAAGFAESDEEGARIQREFTKLAEEHRIPVTGPNCTGLVNLTRQFAAYDGAGRLPDGPPGPVSVVFQSGGLMNPLMETACDRSLRIGKMASVGNAAVLAVEDYLTYFAHDPETSLILSYVESMRDPRRGMAAIEHAGASRKPILMIKAGRSARGRRAAASHTASIVASGRAWEGALAQKGVVLVDSIDELTEAGLLLSLAGQRLFTGGLGFVTISGGDTSLFCDIADKHGLHLAELTPATFTRLKEATGKPSLLGNPLDMGGSHRFGTEGFLKAFDVFIADPGIDVVAVRLAMPKTPTPASLKSFGELKARCDRAGKFLVAFSRASERWDGAWYPAMLEAGIPFLSEFDRGCLALRRWSEYSQFAVQRRSQPRAAGPASDEAMRIEKRPGVWLYKEAEDLVGRFGVPVARSVVASSINDLKAAALGFHYPLVIKVDSRDISHRNAAGGVVVGVRTPDELENAYETIHRRVHKARPEALINGLIVQELVPARLEMIVGIASTPDLGPVVLVGAGGTSVEIAPDVVIGYPPISREEARYLMSRLRLWPRLIHLGGEQSRAVEGMADVVCAVSRLAQHARGIDLQVDLNPVMVSEQGAVAVDILVSSANAVTEAGRLL